MRSCKPLFGQYYKKTMVSAMLPCLILINLLIGCTESQISTVVKDIGVYAQQAEPIVVALAPVIAAFSSGSQDSSAEVLNAFATSAKADLDALATLCNDYSTNPSVSVYERIQGLVDRLVNESDASLLQAAAIKDPLTRQRVQLAMASIDALMHTIDGFVQTTESTSALAAKAKARTIKVRQVADLWSDQDRTVISRAFDRKYETLLQYQISLGL